MSLVIAARDVGGLALEQGDNYRKGASPHWRGWSAGGAWTAVGCVAGLCSLAGWLPWWSVGPAMLASEAIVCAGLMWDNRRLLHTAAASSRVKKSEIRVGLEYADCAGRLAQMKFLFVQNITEAQLREFARRAGVKGESLSIHGWVGIGNLFTRHQYDSLMHELEMAGLVSPGSGNVPRTLTRPGRMLLIKLADASSR